MKNKPDKLLAAIAEIKDCLERDFKIDDCVGFDLDCGDCRASVLNGYLTWFDNLVDEEY